LAAGGGRLTAVAATVSEAGWQPLGVQPNLQRVDGACDVAARHMVAAGRLVVARQKVAAGQLVVARQMVAAGWLVVARQKVATGQLVVARQMVATGRLVVARHMVATVGHARWWQWNRVRHPAGWHQRWLPVRVRGTVREVIWR